MAKLGAASELSKQKTALPSHESKSKTNLPKLDKMIKNSATIGKTNPSG